MGQILVLIVAIVVTVLTYGAATAALGTSLGATITAGAVAGAAGAIASQAVAIGIGLQDDFKWKGIALAAIGGAIGGGLSEFNAFGSAGNLRIAQAAIVAVSGRRSQIPLRPSLRCCVSALPAMRRCILRLTRIVETR